MKNFTLHVLPSERWLSQDKSGQALSLSLRLIFSYPLAATPFFFCLLQQPQPIRQAGPTHVLCSTCPPIRLFRTFQACPSMPEVRACSVSESVEPSESTAAGRVQRALERTEEYLPRRGNSWPLCGGDRRLTIYVFFISVY